MKLLWILLLTGVCVVYSQLLKEDDESLVFERLSQAKAGPDFVSNVLGDNMVLQRAPRKAKLWGWASKPNANVTLVFNGATYNAPSNSIGLWFIILPPQNPSGPFILKLSSTSGDSATIKNVMFGDVWLCGGQSNMQFTLSDGFNATAEIAAAANYPNIRLFTVGQGYVSSVPLSELASIEQRWSVASPSTVGGSDWTYFSAVCWLFGRNLYNRYQIPIGLVSDNWGGTYVQAWTSPTGLIGCNGTVSRPSSSETENKFSNVDFDPNQPSVLYNAMIVPFIPMTLRGSIWYQGEANVGDPEGYKCMFPAMIEDWRRSFGVTSHQFPFFFVQLAAYTEGSPGVLLPQLRLAQMAALDLVATGYATAVDLGDPVGDPYGDIHPRNKQTVGMRLSLAAAAITYGEEVQYLGPTFNTMTIRSGAPNIRIQISFHSSSVGSGLAMVNNQCPSNVGAANCAWYEIQVSNGKWYNATATLVNSHRLDLSLVSPHQPVGTRYLYGEWPVATLFNLDGFPAVPWYYSFWN